MGIFALAVTHLAGGGNFASASKPKAMVPDPGEDECWRKDGRPTRFSASSRDRVAPRDSREAARKQREDRRVHRGRSGGCHFV